MRPHGWVGLPPSQVVEKINMVAHQLGARWQTQGQIERDAERVVADIVRRVKDAQQDGGLKQVNTQYKQYRQAQIEKSEPAIPYSAHVAEFTRSLVLRAAQKSMMQTL
jgi:thiamine pyrophosphate-dependent acetolactate synthase large subunit-like protein